MRLLFLCEYGYAFAKLYNRLKKGDQVQTDDIQTSLGLSSSDMVTIEQYLRQECGFDKDGNSGSGNGSGGDGSGSNEYVSFESSSFHTSEDEELLVAEFNEIMGQRNGGNNESRNSFDGDTSKHVQMDDEQLAGLYNEFLELRSYLVGS